MISRLIGYNLLARGFEDNHQRLDLILNSEKARTIRSPLRSTPKRKNILAHSLLIQIEDLTLCKHSHVFSNLKA